MTTSFTAEIAQVLTEDKTTNNLIAQLAEKSSKTPEEVTQDVSEMFAKYGRFLVKKENNDDAGANEDLNGARGGIAEVAKKYGFDGDKANSILEKLKSGLTKSSDIPSSESMDDDKSKLGKGKKFKIFLICASAVLLVMNIIKKGKK